MCNPFLVELVKSTAAPTSNLELQKQPKVISSCTPLTKDCSYMHHQHNWYEKTSEITLLEYSVNCRRGYKGCDIFSQYLNGSYFCSYLTVDQHSAKMLAKFVCDNTMNVYTFYSPTQYSNPLRSLQLGIQVCKTVSRTPWPGPGRTNKKRGGTSSRLTITAPRPMRAHMIFSTLLSSTLQHNNYCAAAWVQYTGYGCTYVCRIGDDEPSGSYSIYFAE